MKLKTLVTVVATTIMLSSTLVVTAASPEDFFDAEYYASQYPDVVETLGEDEEKLYNHFVTFGMSEGRNGSAYFDIRAYKERYQDLQEAFGDDWSAYYEHYFTYGIEEGRNPFTYEFDPIVYWERYPDLQETIGNDTAALYRHFITYGVKEGRIAYLEIQEPDDDANVSGTDSTDETLDKDKSDDTDTNDGQNQQISKAEERFFSRMGSDQKLITRADEIPYMVSPKGEDWAVTLIYYCDSNENYKYVTIDIDNEGTTFYGNTTYDVYMQWAEGYKTWILENDEFYNPVYMDELLRYGIVVHADGISEYLKIR